MAIPVSLMELNGTLYLATSPGTFKPARKQGSQPGNWMAGHTRRTRFLVYHSKVTFDKLLFEDFATGDKNGCFDSLTIKLQSLELKRNFNPKAFDDLKLLIRRF
jgi:hypothetical protein